MRLAVEVPRAARPVRAFRARRERLRAVDLYHIRGNASAGSNNIWTINPTTGAQTLVYTGYPGGNAATLAHAPRRHALLRHQLGGRLNGAVYRFNPATPAIAPVLLGPWPRPRGRRQRLPHGLPRQHALLHAGQRRRRQHRLYTVNTTNGTATAGPNITGTGNGGDITFIGTRSTSLTRTAGSLRHDRGRRGPLVGTVTFPGGATPGTLGLAADSAGRLLIQTQNPSNLYRITLPSMTSTLFAAAGGGPLDR